MDLTYGELAGLIAAGALAILVIFTIPVLIRAARVAKKAEETIKITNGSIEKISKEVDQLLDQSSDLLDKTNVLMADVNVKMETLDPVVQAAADLGVSVSDVNASSRKMAKRMNNFHLKGNSGILSSILSLLFARRKRRSRKGKDL